MFWGETRRYDMRASGKDEVHVSLLPWASAWLILLPRALCWRV